MKTLKTKQQVKSLIMVLAMVIALSLSMPAVSAQNHTVLTFDPDLVSVPLGNQVQLELWVLDGVNINAFDIEFEYDADVLSLTSWSYGDFLKQLAQVMLVNDPGHFRLAATQLAQPVVSGSGVVLSFTFNTVNLGETLIDLTNGQLSDALGNSTFPALEDAMVRVVNEPTYTPRPPTPTKTPMSTSLPTATSTQRITATPTAMVTSLLSPTPLWTGTTTSANFPPIGGNAEPGEEEYSTPMRTSESWGQIPGELPELQESGEMSSGGTGFELALAPGYEQTAQVNHNATLMAQVAEQQANEENEQNPASTLEVILWILLGTGLVIFVVLFFIAIRRRQKL